MAKANRSSAARALASGVTEMRGVWLALVGVAAGLDHAERRSAVRFPIEQELRYKVTKGNTIEVGSGRSLNVSSTGILFTTERVLAPEDQVELAVNWPARLEGKLPLKLVASGRVVRCDDGWAAVAIERYEFRTQGANGLS